MSKTPAPSVLDENTISYVKNLIEANPRDEKLQGVISKFKDLYPKNFDDISPIPLKELSAEAQKKRKQFIRIAKACNISDSDTTGKVIIPPNTCRDTTFDKMQANLTNFFDKVSGPGSSDLNMSSEIKSISSVMSRTMNPFVNKMTGSMNDKLESVIGDGFAGIKAMRFAMVNPSYPMPAAIKDITAIQNSLSGSVNKLLETVNCLTPNLSNSMEGIVSDLISASIKNTTNASPCATEQLMGAINNKIVNAIDSATTPLLTPILADLLSNGVPVSFNPKDFLSAGINVVKKVAPAVGDCLEKTSCPTSSKYVIGKGIRKGGTSKSDSSNFGKMFKSTALALASVTENSTPFEKEYGSWAMFGGSSDGIDPCNTGNPTKCGGPEVDIFGGGGSGGKGKVILGNYVQRMDMDDIFGGVKNTASIVGVDITNPGSGYESDPFVTFDDECNEGYGAYGRAHVDQNPKSPTYGQITSITIINGGENYPAEDAEVPLFIDKIIIENGGDGYEVGDTLDNAELEISDGRIVSGTMVSRIPYNGLPELNINSETGVGAILKPIMSKTRPQGEVIEIIDCIGK